MTSLRRILTRTFFWCYDRGSWQYDLAVIAILIFVLATPRGWFHDVPQFALPPASEQVKLIVLSDDGHRQIYRVDSRVLAPPPEQTPALQNNLHNALQRSLPELRHGHFSITKIEPVRDEQGTVVAYEVEIRR